MPFDEEKADRAQRFIERALVHTKGKWAGEPFVLADWQRDEIIRPLFGTVRDDGTRQYRTAYLEVARKNGKALALDTPIPTPDGWTTQGELRPGDYVFDETGAPCPVTAVTTTQHDRPCYRVTFSDGTSIDADAEHEWYTECRRTGRPSGKRWKPEDYIHTTAEILETISIADDHVEWNHRVPVAGPLSIPDAEFPVDPYVFGAWLGDGNSYCARITCSKKDLTVIHEIEAAGERIGDRVEDNGNAICVGIGLGDVRGRHDGTSLNERLISLGVLKNKHIPAQYLRGSFRQRLHLLQGLMDTDGYVSKAGQCEFTSTKRELADGVVELCRTLGLKPSLVLGRAQLNGADCGPKYRVQFWAFDDLPIFRLERKRIRQKARPAKRTRSMYRQIVSVEPIDSVPVRCIQVDSPSHLYLAGPGMVPTHNSELAAAIALYLLLMDGEGGAEIYGAACDREQASIVYRVAADMVRRSPTLRKMCKVVDSRKTITVEATGSFYRAIPAEAAGAHGYNAHGIIFDELHAQPNRDLWDVLTTSTGARSQPLVFAITTAGFDRQSICWEMHEYARKVAEGIVEDPSFFAWIKDTPEDADWQDESVWHMANPGLGDFRDIDEMRMFAKRAKETPALENTFRRLYLSQWTQSETRYIPMDKWAASAGEVDFEALRGRECYAGLDLATVNDVAALSLVFPPDDVDGAYKVLPFFWIPEDNMHERVRRDRVPYDAWVRQGYITATAGNVIDYNFIRAKLNELADIFYIKEVAFDRWGATKIMTDLQDDNFSMVQFGQGFASMSAPTKELLKLVLEGRLHHGDNPVLRWMCDNLVVKMDPAGNVKPDKEKSTEKIDGMVALIMALDRATRHLGSQKLFVEVF